MCSCGQVTPQLKHMTSSSHSRDEGARHLFKPNSLESATSGHATTPTACEPAGHPQHARERPSIHRDSHHSLGVASDQGSSCDITSTSVSRPPAHLDDSRLGSPPSDTSELADLSLHLAPAASGSIVDHSTGITVAAAAPAKPAAPALVPQVCRIVLMGHACLLVLIIRSVHAYFLSRAGGMNAMQGMSTLVSLTMPIKSVRDTVYDIICR